MASDTEALAGNWWAVTIRGVAAILFGVLTFVMPIVTLATLVLLFGAYAIVDGVFMLVSVFRGREGDRSRWVMVLEGIVRIAAGIVAFAWPGRTAVAVVYVIAAWSLVTGILEIAAAIRLRREIRGEVWLGLSGVLSIVFAAVLMVAPGVGALAVVLWIGAYAIVFGALLVGLSLRLRREQRMEQRPIARAA
jgi:uncharacterized membrane protein HdeD (DUF308 family)